MNLNFLIKKIPVLFCCHHSPWKAVVDFGGSAHQESSSRIQPQLIQQLFVPFFLLCSYWLSVLFLLLHTVSKDEYKMNLFLMSPSEMTASSPYSLNCSETMNSN